MRHLVVALAMALLLAGSALSAGSGIDAFVTNSLPLEGKPPGSDTFISVIDNGGVSSVPVGSVTQSVAMDPSGARVFVASALGTQGVIYAIDAKKKSLAGTATLSTEVRSPFGIAVSPDGKHLYMSHIRVVVLRSGKKITTAGFLSILDVTVKADGTVDMAPAGSPVFLGGSTTGVAVGRWLSGYRVYVANSSGYISVYDPTQTNPWVATVWMDMMKSVNLVGVAVSPDGTRVYAADKQPMSATDKAGKLWVVDAGQGGSSPVVITSVRVGANPYGVAVSPKDGRFVFVANVDSDSVSVVDTSVSGYRVDPVGVGDSPHGVSVTADGTRAYVVNRGLDTNQPSVSILTRTAGTWTATTIASGASLNSPVEVVTSGTPTIPVRIDVVPAAVNLKAQGTIPVKIFGGADNDLAHPDFPKFDVHNIDFSTIYLGCWGVKGKPNGDWMANFGDFDGDGLEDVMVHISADRVLENCDQNSQFSSSTAGATLVGQSSDGAFQGSDDSVRFH